MPVYMDSHDGTNLPSALRTKVESRIKSGQRDEHGVMDRGVVIDRVGNKMHCILDGPNPQAIMKHHESLQVPLDRNTIHEADVILK